MTEVNGGDFYLTINRGEGWWWWTMMTRQQRWTTMTTTMDHGNDGQWLYDDNWQWWRCDGMRRRWTMTTMDHDNNGRWQMTMMVGWWRWRDGGERWGQFLFNNQQGRGMTMMDNVDKTTTMNDNDSNDGPQQWWTMTMRRRWTMMKIW